MAGTDIGEALKGYVKFSPDAMSAVQADEFNQAWQEAQQRLSEEHAASLETDRAAMLGEERVFEDVKNKGHERRHCAGSGRAIRQTLLAILPHDGGAVRSRTRASYTPPMGLT